MFTSAANLRARLNRDELHQLRWLLGLALLLLAFWTLFSLEVGGVGWRTLFFLTAASAMVFPGWPGRIPDWIRRWALILGAAALFTQFIATKFDLISGLVLLVSLLALSRGLQYRRLREDWQLILLSLFIIILTGVLTLSLLFGLQILIFTLVAMALLFVMNLVERDAERALTVEDWRHFRWLQFAQRVRGAIDLRQLFLAAALFTGLVLVSTLIFISIPRFQFSQSFNFPSMHGVAGFHGDIVYNEIRDVDTDDSIAFRVDVPTGVQLPQTPYWRMIVLDQYRDNGFRLSESEKRDDYRSNVAHYSPANFHGRPRPFLSDVSVLGGTFIFYLEGNVSDYLPVLGPFDTLNFNAPQAFHADDTLYIYHTEQPSMKVLGYQVENMALDDAIPDGTLVKKTNFSLQTASELTKSGGNLPYPLTYYGLPRDATDLSIVNGIVGQIDPNRTMSESGFIIATVKFLREHHEGSMSVDISKARSNRPGEPPAHDVLVQWLDSNSPGWCEHFAGGLALLCRARGFPTRVVAGYRGAVYNSIENYYFVKQSFAHAWDEVYDTETKDRWLRVDPSPGAEVELPGMAPSGQFASGITTESGWSAFFDGLRMIWYRRVINFDQSDQQELVATVSNYGKDFESSITQRFKDAWQAVEGWFSEPLTSVRAIVLSTLIVLLEIAFLCRRRLRNYWLRYSARLWRGVGRPLEPVRLDAGRWLRRFLPAWEALAPTLPSPERAEWSGVRLDLLTLRYGPPDFPTDPAGTFRKARLLLRKASRRRGAAKNGG